MLIYNFIFSNDMTGGTYSVTELKDHFNRNMLATIRRIVSNYVQTEYLVGITIRGFVNYDTINKYIAEITFQTNNINILRDINKWTFTNYDENRDINSVSIGDDILDKLKININSLQNMTDTITTLFPNHSNKIQKASNLLATGRALANTDVGKQLLSVATNKLTSSSKTSTLGKLANILTSKPSASTLSKLNSVLTSKPTTTKSTVFKKK
jgi:hypothetical protein